jgi:glucan-binding YG repeat protein
LTAHGTSSQILSEAWRDVQGLMKFGTNMRYFGTDGKMATGLTKATNGNWYYFNSNGIRLYGG